jgi:hypothetical protein
MKFSSAHALAILKVIWYNVWCADEWIWGRSIYSIIKPSFNMTLLQYFWRFTQICKKFEVTFAKLFLLLFLSNFTIETITKTILRANAANFLQICANVQKYWNNAMSNDGSSIENNRSVSWRLSCIKFRSKYSSNTVLCLLRKLMHQTLSPAVSFWQ